MKLSSIALLPLLASSTAAKGFSLTINTLGISTIITESTTFVTEYAGAELTIVAEGPRTAGIFAQDSLYSGQGIESATLTITTGTSVVVVTTSAIEFTVGTSSSSSSKGDGNSLAVGAAAAVGSGLIGMLLLI